MSDKQFPSQMADRFMIRLPDGMRDQISAAAKASNRTMNAEIVSRLEFTFAVDMTVHDTGWDVAHGTNSLEMNAALLKQRRGGETAGATASYTRWEVDQTVGTLRNEIQELRNEIEKLKIVS